VELVADAPVVQGRVAVGSGPGGLPIVNVYDGGGTLMRSFLAYDAAFRGGVRVAQIDLNRDGIQDVVTAPGPGGGPHVKVFDGLTGSVLFQFMAYDPAFRGGVFVAVGDTNGDFIPDIITGAGAGGGPHVILWDGQNASQGNLAYQKIFFAYDPRFTGGVSVACGDVNGDLRYEIITGPGPGGGPDIRVFDSYLQRPVTEFNAYDPAFRGGVFVAAGDVDGDFKADVITGTGRGGVPLVRAFGGMTGALLTQFYAYNPAFLGGVVVGSVELDPDHARSEIVTGAGPGGGPHVRVFDATGTVRYEWFAFDPAFTGGVFVG
jgi:hypothetical protein